MAGGNNKYVEFDITESERQNVGYLILHSTKHRIDNRGRIEFASGGGVWRYYTVFSSNVEGYIKTTNSYKKAKRQFKLERYYDKG